MRSAWRWTASSSRAFPAHRNSKLSVRSFENLLLLLGHWGPATSLVKSKERSRERERGEKRSTLVSSGGIPERREKEWEAKETIKREKRCYVIFNRPRMANQRETPACGLIFSGANLARLQFRFIWLAHLFIREIIDALSTYITGFL